jgi:hypothetical protein
MVADARIHDNPASAILDTAMVSWPRVTRFRSRALAASAVSFLLVAMCFAASGVAAQESGPAAAISAYSAALNAHDLAAGLALFDQYGSATDAHGRHFEGPAGLTEFLLDSGFSSLDARITTEGLHVVANRAVWTYKCSCAAGSTEVRLVVNHDRISVFAVLPPPTAAAPKADAGVLAWLVGRAQWSVAVLPWLVGLGLAAGARAALAMRWGRVAASSPRPNQGRLLAALAQARQRRDPVSN